MIWKTEHGGENPDFDFVPRLFTLLTYLPYILHPASVVAARSKLDGFTSF